MSNKKKILVIDDEQQIQDLLKKHLEAKKYEVTVYGDGVSALEYLKKESPDLIITDLLLPREHGANLVKTIKENYFIPVIIISGIYSKDELKSFIENHKVEAYFEKPFRLEKIDQAIDTILNA